MHTFKLEIITPVRQAYAQDVISVSVPSDMGQIQILKNHEPLFCSLTDGELAINDGKKEMLLAIGGGFLQVSGDKTTVLVSRAVHAEEINETEIRKAQEKAKEILSRKVSDAEFAAAQAVLRRSILEFKVLRHKQRKHTSLT